MFFLAVLGGILTTLSMVINSSLGKRIGVLQSTLINYIVGLIFSLLALIFIGNNIKFSEIQFERLPIYIFLGGVIGVIVVYSSNIIIPRIPVVFSALLLFLGQVLAGIVIDFFMSGSLSYYKLIGAVIVILGILYNSKIDATDKGKVTKSREE